MYGSKCKTHNFINNTDHITNEHGLESIRNLMALFNSTSRTIRKNITQRTNHLLKAIT